MLRSARNLGVPRVAASVNNEPSMAIQSAKDEADINVMVRRFGVTALARDVAVPPGVVVVEDFDFRDAMDRIRSANESFAGMSAAVRRRFANDASEFYLFCTARDADGKLVNLDEMRKFGLAVPEPVKEPEAAPMRVHVVSCDVPGGNPKP